MCKDDSKLIDDLGGPAKVARLLGYPNQGGVQRVQNWKSRGIPPKVRLERPDLFQVPTVQGRNCGLDLGHVGRQSPPAHLFVTVPEQSFAGNFSDMDE